MERTQIYLDAEDVDLLEQAARTTGASRSELIRRAIRSTFGRPSPADRLAALQRGAGLWKDRDFTGSTYVEASRGNFNERLGRLGLD